MGVRRWAVLVFVLLALSPLAFWGCRSGWEAKATATLREELDRLLAEARGRSGERPVLRGTPQPGKAWDQYRQACRKDLSVQESFLPFFQAGLLRTNGRRDRDWERPEGYPSTGFTTALTQTAQTLVEQGKNVEAANLILDLIQFCGDLSRNGSREDWERADSLRFDVLFLLKNRVETGSLPRDEWARLARELELLDRGFPSLADVLVNSAMSQGCFYVDVSKSISLLPKEGQPGWRYLFSERIAVTYAFLDELDCMRRLAELDAAPWPEALARVEQVKTDYAASKNPILQQHSKRAAEHSANLLHSSRTHRTWLRLLQTACAWRANGDLIELDDPFGDKLRHTVDPQGTLSAWSRGPYGEDGKADVLLIRLAK